jgi:dolichol-phosphate mannosyltransferase
VQSHGQETLSIIVPTYNESENILRLLERIRSNIPVNIAAEIIVVDDNSPDGTGKLVEGYIRTKIDSPHLIQQENNGSNSIVRIIHSQSKNGLISAILRGIRSSTGRNILVMDADFSHPPEMIPKMLRELLNSNFDLVVASRYVNGSSIVGWPVKRRLISSSASKIARHGLKVGDVKDPMSGFFLIRREVLENITFDTAGYKLLLEILVKVKNLRIKELPYTFRNRSYGESKLDSGVAIDYLRAVWRLYCYGQKSRQALVIKERRKSVLFFSKAARFYTVGATGLLVNYLVSFLFSNGMLSSFFYLHAATIGIICSITSNFFLNKAWTFEDMNFSLKHTAKQYGLYSAFSAIGAVIQLSLLYIFVDSYAMDYAFSLLLAVAISSVGNFLLNKKWTFGEKIWS